MECGVSTACFYPEETLEGLKHLGHLNVSIAEVFLNTARELTPAYANALSLILQKYGMRIASLLGCNLALRKCQHCTARQHVDGWSADIEVAKRRSGELSK